ncbi:hypothetical protein Pint_03284 [Pistacia integerrima]|uniref:Uncharacterized protein n=1 Tax=Pistacia integerrima TaxID=434235 RepID=A0ACC0ZHQ7_9ROSI|nr:hypothetical protein Pint_03284 [Pistacia integerrima]
MMSLSKWSNTLIPSIQFLLEELVMVRKMLDTSNFLLRPFFFFSTLLHF